MLKPPRGDGQRPSSAVPSGLTEVISGPEPSDKSLGYYRVSLRDENGAILPVTRCIPRSPGPEGTVDNSPPLQRWEYERKATGQSWKDDRRGYSRDIDSAESSSCVRRFFLTIRSSGAPPPRFYPASPGSFSAASLQRPASASHVSRFSIRSNHSLYRSQWGQSYLA